MKKHTSSTCFQILHRHGLETTFSLQMIAILNNTVSELLETSWFIIGAHRFLMRFHIFPHLLCLSHGEHTHTLISHAAERWPSTVYANEPLQVRVHVWKRERAGEEKKTCPAPPQHPDAVCYRGNPLGKYRTAGLSLDGSRVLTEHVRNEQLHEDEHLLSDVSL